MFRSFAVQFCSNKSIFRYQVVLNPALVYQLKLKTSDFLNPCQEAVFFAETMRAADRRVVVASDLSQHTWLHKVNLISDTVVNMWSQLPLQHEAV